MKICAECMIIVLISIYIQNTLSIKNPISKTNLNPNQKLLKLQSEENDDITIINDIATPDVGQDDLIAENNSGTGIDITNEENELGIAYYQNYYANYDVPDKNNDDLEIFYDDLSNKKQDSQLDEGDSKSIPFLDSGNITINVTTNEIKMKILYSVLLSLLSLLGVILSAWIMGYLIATEKSNIEEIADTTEVIESKV